MHADQGLVRLRDLKLVVPHSEADKSCIMDGIVEASVLTLHRRSDSSSDSRSRSSSDWGIRCIHDGQLDSIWIGV